jgi:hypothetical protein
MTNRRRSISRDDALLITCAIVLGLAVAAAFGAYRAVSADAADSAAWLSEFTSNLVWPGVLIFAGVAGAVFAGWKANID